MTELHLNEHDPELDRALQALPHPRAPRSLLPRVMLAVDARAAQPWYRRPWFGWPRAWQAASILAGVTAGIVAALSWPSMVEAARSAMIGVDARVWFVGDDVVRRLREFASAAFVIRRVAEPALLVLLVWMSVMLMACAACAAALRRMGLGEE